VRLAALKAAASHLIYISSHSILLIVAAARLPSPIAGITLALQVPCIFKRNALCLYFLLITHLTQNGLNCWLILRIDLAFYIKLSIYWSIPKAFGIDLRI